MARKFGTKTYATVAAGAVALAGLGWWAYAPYRAVERFRQAADSGDPNALLAAIDSAAIERHLQVRFRAQAQRPVPAGQTSPFMVLGPSMTQVMADRYAWEYAQRAAVVRTVYNKRASTAEDALTPSNPDPFLGASRGYSGLNRFEVTLTEAPPVRLVFERRGFSWAATDLDIDPFASTSPAAAVTTSR